MSPTSKSRTPGSGRPGPGARGVVFIHPGPAPAFVPFPAGRMILGRDPAAGIPLDGKAVSWQHAELTNEGGETVIRDLDSTNGVMVRGLRVKEAALVPGALVRIGDFLGVVSDGPPPVPERDVFGPDAQRLGLSIGPQLAMALAPVAGVGPRSKKLRFAVEGETGTGKALIARLIHARVRPDGPFAIVDAAAITGEAELAELLVHAERGTVFIANLATMPVPAQLRLAAALARPDAKRLCVVAGSQLGLPGAMADGDLAPALHAPFSAEAAHVVRLPPLRERVMDIPGLFRHLLALHKIPGRGRGRTPTLSTELVERLCLYDWPCNVREMVLIVQRLLALHGDEPRLRAAHLPARFVPADREDTTSPISPVAGVKLSALLDAVRDAGGDINGAAIRLGITRERAYRLIDRLGLVRGSA